MIELLFVAVATINTFVVGYFVGAFAKSRWDGAIELSIRTQKDLKETARLVAKIEHENEQLRIRAKKSDEIVKQYLQEKLNKQFSESDEVKNLLNN